MQTATCSQEEAAATPSTLRDLQEAVDSRNGAVKRQDERWSFLALLFELLRKSLLGCRTVGGGADGGCGMEIGLPTDVHHAAHVTFDRFHGLPVEFEPEVPRRAPSARSVSCPISFATICFFFCSLARGPIELKLRFLFGFHFLFAVC
jgi:hypothetical protein